MFKGFLLMWLVPSIPEYVSVRENIGPHLPADTHQRTTKQMSASRGTKRYHYSSTHRNSQNLQRRTRQCFEVIGRPKGPGERRKNRYERQRPQSQYAGIPRCQGCSPERQSGESPSKALFHAIALARILRDSILSALVSSGLLQKQH